MHEHGGSFWEEYWGILSDPAHFTAELTFTLLDMLILSPLFFFAWKGVKSWVGVRIAHEHHVLDVEHEVEHAPHACETCGKSVLEKR